MKARKLLNRKKEQRANRVRAKISGTAAKPRLAVFRSNQYIYAQLIDDAARRTLAAASSRDLGKTAKPKNKTEAAALVGAALASKAKTAGITVVVFDRRSYNYHGRVRALAESARQGGLKF